jgi:Domain of unknown function (DUF4258)
MKTIETIRQQLAAGDFEFSRHGFQRAIERDISDQEVREAGRQAVIIEEYPADKYSPSCLLLGFTRRDRPLHLQVSRAETELVKIITIYEPDAEQWINLMDRR